MENSLALLDKKEFSDKTVTITKYAKIRIVGEKEERTIKWETYQKIKSLPEKFTGSIEIEELGLTLPRNQIVKMEEKENIDIVQKNFTQLPTETVLLDKDFNILNKTRVEIEREHDQYYIATCHYVIDNGEKQYYLSKPQIKSLAFMARDEDPDYPHYVEQAFRYGRDVRDIEKEAKKNKRKK